jgi:hypothetical protein
MVRNMGRFYARSLIENLSGDSGFVYDSAAAQRLPRSGQALYDGCSTPSFLVNEATGSATFHGPTLFLMWPKANSAVHAAIPREVLRVECARCSRCVEIRQPDAVRLFGPHAVWKDVAQRLLNEGCRIRTGRHEEDGCWPDFSR